MMSLLTMKLRLLGQIALLLVLIAPTYSVGQDEAISLDSILKAWDGRAAKIRSFSCAWEGTRYELVDKSDQDVAAQKAGAKVMLPEHITYKFNMRFIADDRGRARFDYEGQEWSAKDSKLVPNRIFDIFDGSDRVTFSPGGGAGAVNFPNAHIRKASAADSARDRRTTPFRLAFRPLDRAMWVFDRKKLELTHERGVVDGQQCVMLRHNDWVVWVDPARQFIPLRLHENRRGVMVRSLDIGYTRHDQLGWAPRKFKDVWLGDTGIVYSSIDAVVSDCSINRSIPDDTFKFDYPYGTWVRNYDTNERYLVRKDGERRPILPGEFTGTNYEELLNSDPPGKGGRRWRIVVTILTVSLAVLLVAFWYRRRMRSKLPDSGAQT